MRVSVAALGLCAPLVVATATAAAPCLDVSKGQPHELSGTLDRVVFPGAPNFEDVRKGDAPEPTYILRLDHKICITGDGFSDPATMFDAVHLVADHDDWAPLKANLHRKVTVTLVRPMGAETGHHHEPLVAWVTSVQPR